METGVLKRTENSFHMLRAEKDLTGTAGTWAKRYGNFINIHKTPGRTRLRQLAQPAEKVRRFITNS